MKETCTSCKADISNIANSVIFKCPECNEKLVRCGDCRKMSIRYKCKCGFEGP